MPSSQLLKPLWKIDVGEFVRDLAWTPDGTTLCIAPAEGPVAFVNGENSTRLHEVDAHAMGTLAIAVSPNGELLATGGQGKKAKLFRVADASPVAELETGGSTCEHLAWNPHSQLLATGSGKSVRLWDGAGQKVYQFPDLKFGVQGLQWRRDGAYVASVSFDGIRLWEQGKEWPMLSYDHQISLIALAWAPNQDILICGTQDATILIWSTQQGDDFQAGPYPVKVRELAWDYRSRFLASGGGADVALWDFGQADMQGAKPRFLEGHTLPITQIAYQKVGPLFASGGKDGALFFWKPEAGDQPVAFAESQSEVSRIAWHPKDRAVAVGYANGDVILWPVPGH